MNHTEKAYDVKVLRFETLGGRTPGSRNTRSLMLYVEQGGKEIGVDLNGQLIYQFQDSILPADEKWKLVGDMAPPPNTKAQIIIRLATGRIKLHPDALSAWITRIKTALKPAEARCRAEKKAARRAMIRRQIKRHKVH